MSDLGPHLAALRQVMADFPKIAAHRPQDPIDLKDIYFPRSHAAALDPDRSLVVGNRGMGKSFWASALVNSRTRGYISEQLPKARLGQGQIDVQFGFANSEGVKGISRDELSKCVNSGASMEMIWRAVTLTAIAEKAELIVPEELSDRLSWVQSDPADVRDLMRTADARLSEKSGKLLFVFDQLEDLSEDLDIRRQLTQGILKLALAFKNYRSLRVKIFMRPDHFLEDNLFTFADASKIKGEAVTLDWRGVDLYGLLYALLLQGAQSDFMTVSKFIDMPIKGDLLRYQLTPTELLKEYLTVDEDIQHRLFDIIAGEVMGSEKRGLPYTWLLSHLADARNQVSPRTFLSALKHAAEHRPAPKDKVIDYLGIHEGVRQASLNRVDDLKEDYPWVPPALKALEGSLVPCLPSEMIEKWRSSRDLAKDLLDSVKEKAGKRPSWLTTDIGKGEAPYEALLQAMADIGVIEIRHTTGKVDVPDIFRLPVGIKRKGGITQQQRRKALKLH